MKGKESKNERLTEKQLVFCREMAKGNLPPFSALKAGYGGGDLKKAEYQAKKLVKNGRIQKRISELGKAGGKNADGKKAGRRTRQDVIDDVAYGVEQAKKYNDLNNLFKFLSLEAKIFGLEKENLNITGSIDLKASQVLKEAKNRVSRMRADNAEQTSS